MSWSADQIKLAKIAMKAANLNDGQYRIVLRNVAGIWPVAGKVSATNPSASNAGFERYMAYCEKHGFVDRVHGPHHWQQCAARQCDRMWRKIEAVAAEGVRFHLISADGLPGFVERMTQNRPLTEGGSTRELSGLDAEYTFRVLEGLKAWLRREAKNHNIQIDFERALSA